MPTPPLESPLGFRPIFFFSFLTLQEEEEEEEKGDQTAVDLVLVTLQGETDDFE